MRFNVENILLMCEVLCVLFLTNTRKLSSSGLGTFYAYFNRYGHLLQL